MDPYSDPIGAALQGSQTTSTRHASDWGLASLLIALTLLLLFPIVLGVIFIGVELMVSRVNSSDMGMVTTLADVTAYGFMILAGLALLFGLVGLISGFVRTQPLGLPTAALVVSLLAVILWALMFFAIMGLKREVFNRRNPSFHHPNMIDRNPQNF